MKMHVEHRVPLSNSAVELLRATAANSNRPPDAYVFAGQKRGCPLSNVSMTAVLKRMRLGHLTVHGMRSTDRKRVVKGKSVSVRVDLGGRGRLKNKKTHNTTHTNRLHNTK